MSRQARQRRRRHGGRRGHAYAAHRRRACCATALVDRQRSRRSHTSSAWRTTTPRLSSLHADAHRRLLAGLSPPTARASASSSPKSCARPWAGADPGEPAERDGRDRGPALLQTQRRRRHRHLPLGHQGHHQRLGAAGRLDDHDAARCATSTWATTTAHFKQKIEEAKIALDYAKYHSKREILTELPQQRPLRHRRRADRDRRAGGGEDVLRQTRLAAEPRSSRRCSPGCRRRPPSTTPSSTPPRPRERRNEVLSEDGRTALHHRRRRPLRPSTHRWR